ncbi:MAG: hypothetical protein IIC33_10450 [Chloroflexi bacterium]|nr:hypothetical protein [Chloroflexota bacterium]
MVIRLSRRNGKPIIPTTPFQAGLFLKEFVGDTPWVHLDIAGTSTAERTKGYQVKGATGVPARTLARLASNLAESSG